MSLISKKTNCRRASCDGELNRKVVIEEDDVKFQYDCDKCDAGLTIHGSNGYTVQTGGK